MIIAGPGVEITGDGSPINPYVISADEDSLGDSPGDDSPGDDSPGDITCDEIRGCLTAGPGVTYDEGSGAIAASVAAWPYPCPVDEHAGQVYTDSAGQLRTRPAPITNYGMDHVNESYDNVTVPAGFDNVIVTRQIDVVNPDPCREAFVIMSVEVDIDFNLPAGSGAAGGISGDEMQYFANTGTAAMNDVHGQVVKVFQRTIAPGETLREPLEVSMGRGSGGATYNRIQTLMRYWIFVLADKALVA